MSLLHAAAVALATALQPACQSHAAEPLIVRDLAPENVREMLQDEAAKRGWSDYVCGLLLRLARLANNTGQGSPKFITAGAQAPKIHRASVTPHRCAGCLHPAICRCRGIFIDQLQ